MTEKIGAHIPLKGLDHFFLALENHQGNSTTVGNTCRYFLELNGTLTQEEFRLHLQNHPLSQELAAIRLKRKSITSGSVWVIGEPRDLLITEIKSDDQLPQLILERNILLTEETPLLEFVLVQHSTGNTTLVLLWHHLLMDGYGSVLYLRSLNGEGQIGITTASKLQGSFTDAGIAMKYVRRSSEKPLCSPFTGEIETNPTPGIHCLEISAESCSKIADNARKNGALFGQSSYFLAACSLAVFELMVSRNQEVSNFWVPMPQNQRRVNAKSPVLSNHLSLLFFRIRKSRIESGLATLTQDLTRQMKAQIKEDIPGKYNSLMHYLRRVPGKIYYRFIKGPHGGALASFLFTVAPEHPADFMTFMARPIADARNLPPITYPPGLTFAFAKHDTKTRIFVGYTKELFSDAEIKRLSNRIAELLVNGKRS
jgi:hypothetical protein